MSEVVLSWTEERVSALHRMVASGLTAEQIAAELGGVSRNGVIGKVHRLGLNFARAGTVWPKAPAPKTARVAKPSIPRKPAPRPAPVVMAPPEPEIDPTPKLWPKPAGAEAVALDELRARHCRMPLWDILARGGLYCGKPVRAAGESWCAACAKLVYEPRPIRAQEEINAARARWARQLSSDGAFAS